MKFTITVIDFFRCIYWVSMWFQHATSSLPVFIESLSRTSDLQSGKHLKHSCTNWKAHHSPVHLPLCKTLFLSKFPVVLNESAVKWTKTTLLRNLMGYTNWTEWLNVTVLWTLFSSGNCFSRRGTDASCLVIDVVSASTVTEHIQMIGQHFIITIIKKW